MLVDFFFQLRKARIPVSTAEFLVLLDALGRNVIAPSLDDFYFLARLTLVKKEAHFDKFDLVFAQYCRAMQATFDTAALGRLEQLKERTAPQHGDAERGESTNHNADKSAAWRELLNAKKSEALESPDGAGNDRGGRLRETNSKSPTSQRISGKGGQRGPGGNRSAPKVWEARTYRDYDDQRELGTRNIKIALRRLRRFAREGAEEEFALDGTIQATATNAGQLDIRMQPERKNKVKVLMLLDVGGSMDDHIAQVEELFSASKSEFKNLDFYYFHNCVYDYLWKSNGRRQAERFSTWDILRKFRPDTKLIFVGDATMRSYEISQPGGSVEYNNPEAGADWLERFTTAFPKYVWINPEPEGLWKNRQSIELIRQLMNDRMFPLTIAGLERAMNMLKK
ncbi:hypothetical protein SAMN04515618_11741 [Collimonas sp. OK307]|uniref:vWA domain-containing protein n=1 Tax=Collimonas sp. OK307 TaxID=1801620 RepID=UPI0008F0C1B2|nr:hypothetical protein [Collimonas sp. OK307]SFI31970.1 hypothetical protein SAMN04515618_11741 [Collimonas sp. OK307]